jgi:hypothetical protein
MEKDSKLARVKNVLLHELSSDTVNTLKVRELCRDNPGLIATSSLRVRIWSLLLLGDVAIRDSERAPQADGPCMEQQVLDADVRRTRGDMQTFRSADYQALLLAILQGFCCKHNVQYKQGMNELLAPFIQVNPPPCGSGLTFSIYEAFLFRYLERFFCRDESSFLFKGFRMFHILLMYVDPQLGEHLHEQNFPPELYAPQWFLTLYSRGLPLPLVLRLWDMLIAVDDPAFSFFIGLCMLRQHRAYLIMSGVDSIPEIISGIHITSEADVDKLVVDALQIYRLTPRCFLRALRLCAVSSTQLAPKPVQHKAKVSRVARTKWNRHDETMAKQAIRSCVTLSANELVSKLAPVSTEDLKVKSKTRDVTKRPRPHYSSSSSTASNASSPGHATVSCQSTPPASPRLPEKQEGEDSPEASPDTRFSTGHGHYTEDGKSGLNSDQQVVLIDLRTEEDAEGNGGGTIAKAIRLDPDCMNDPEMLSKWLQHFDGIKGCVICVIDMPPAQAPEVALWRRLLLGEGDGYAPGTINYGGDEAGGDGLDVSQRPMRDYESPFAKLEEATLRDDTQRAGMRFCMELQRNGFPYVSLLEGGFPSLVEALFNLRGTVEPIIIQHNAEAWQYYLRCSGRVQEIPRKSAGSVDDNSSDGGSDGTKKSSGGKSATQFQFPVKKLKDMNELERAKTAYKVAVSLNHDRMAAVLKIKIYGMSDGSSTTDIPVLKLPK